MLSDRQSIILCGVFIGIFFICGILELLDNYAIKTVLAIIFIAILVNFIYTVKSKKEK